MKVRGLIQVGTRDGNYNIKQEKGISVIEKFQGFTLNIDYESQSILYTQTKRIYIIYSILYAAYIIYETFMLNIEVNRNSTICLRNFKLKLILTNFRRHFHFIRI